MAKNNLFLGMAKGSVGDVVFYRRNGAQVSRARNRSPHNPRTPGQATQRAFFAPVGRFYAPLAQVLETSYEGLSRSDSYSRFLSDNIKAARTNGWYVPKNAPFWPLPYTLSKGTLRPVPQLFDGTRYQFWYPGNQDSLGAPVGSLGHLSRSMVSQGYSNGDQLTFIVVLPDGVGGYYPAWQRVNLDIDSFTPIGEVITTYAFAAEYENGAFYLSTEYDDMAAAAVIISRFEAGIWRRSTQKLVLTEATEQAIMSANAITNAIDSYRGQSGVPVSDVYLNGGTAEGGGKRYVGGVELAPGTPVVTPTYLSEFGQSSFVVAGDGSATDLLTVSGVAVSTGEVINNAAVCIGITTAEGVVTGHFVGVDVTGAQPAYTHVQVTGRDLVQAIAPRCGVYDMTDQFHVNARQFLLDNGIPESALSFS